MPNTISNHFAITALQEGVTVQGSLRIDGTLSQAWNNNTQKAIPNWKATQADPNPSQPRVYPVVRKGVQYMNNAQLVNTHWLYNDVVITFDNNGDSTNCVDANNDPLFHVGTTTVSLGGSSYLVPCLTVIANLATATNIDIDTIGYEGSIELLGKQQPFQCAVDVKISQMSAQGYLGLLSPESAIITEKNQSVSIAASLYAEDGQSPASWYTKWYNAGTGDEYVAARNARSFTVNEADVTDNLIIRCDFFTDSNYANRVTTAFASIDDTQDPEFLYISLNGSNSDFSGQLSPGESCTVTAWVAAMEDSTDINTGYTNFSCRLYDGQQNEISSGPTMTTSNNRGTMTIPYDFVAQNGYKVNGIVTAS